VTSERSDRQAGERKARATTGAEFDAGLDHAEGLLAAADAHRHAADRHLAVVALAVAASLVVLTSVAATGVGLTAVLLATVVIAVTDLVLIGFVVRAVVVPLRRTAAREERCAVDTVGILREVLPVLSRDEHWSLFRVEWARLRMSQFGIAARQQR
jgi:hypothetical protein